MKNSTIVRVVLLGAIAIVSVIALQTYWIKKTWDIKEQEFQEKVNIALLNVVAEFRKVNTLPVYNLIEKVTGNYYVVNINQSIHANELEFYLKKNLEALGLKESFQYAIYDCESNKMVGCALVNYDAENGTSTTSEQIELPIYDKYLYYFGIRFPERDNHILSSMIPLMIPVGILLITLIFFTYSIIIILRQRQLSEMQRDFINNMTHEFKTPISTIKISADVFLREATIQENKRLKRYATIIKEQNERLNHQVEKVLQLARIERTYFQLKKEYLNLHDVIQTCLDGIEINVEELGGTIDKQFEAQNSNIFADRLHLTNLILNLLDNSIKYCKKHPSIKIQTVSHKKHLQLIVQDNGIGIAKEHQNKIAQKFYRVPTGDVHNVKGFGLGLFYVKNVCKSHDWKWCIDSETDKGTTITITMKI